MTSDRPPVAMPAVVTLAQAAAKLGAWCWAERRCFEILGGWVRETPEPELKALFASHSRHHAWRADRWAEILPRAYVAPADELVTAPGDAAIFEQLAALDSSAQRVEGHYDVVYRTLLDAYRASPDLMNPLTDRPALRAIRIIVGDAVHDLEEVRTASRDATGGISGPDHLAQLYESIAKTQVRALEPGEPASALRSWGS